MIQDCRVQIQFVDLSLISRCPSIRMAPLAINNIDTDQIIPARFLKTVSK